MTTLTGHCFCGHVRYAATAAPTHPTLCHCTICRRVSGAPMVAWLTVPTHSFRFTAGEPASFASSDHGTRTFCPRCGTPLTFRSARSVDEIDLTTCSLDDPEQVPPQDHTQTATRLGWMESIDVLPSFPAARS